MATVLVVEDEDIQRKTIDTILRASGHQVLLAGNGAQALLVAVDKRPDIILSDINMPKMSGVELCQKVRATSEIAATYIILITAHEKEGTRDAALEAGADDFVRKPVEMDDLVTRVRIGSRSHKVRAEADGLRAKAGAYQKTQDSLVAALDAAVKGLEETAGRLQQSDPGAALAVLQESHAEVQRLLAGVELPEGGGG
jgi:DNA-binding response OmpR family regulator